MNISDRTLNFVFNDDVKKPLLVECYWKKGNWREPLQLLDEHVGQAKKRRDALCILFLLAKYRAVRMGNTDEFLRFKVDLKKQTWVGTLGDAYKIKEEKQPVRKWVETHFSIGRSDHFFTGHSGSDRAGGKAPRKVEYNTKQFPPQNLQFYTRPADDDSTELKPLSLDRLFSFAEMIEAIHWSESAIKELVRKGVLRQFEQNGTAKPWAGANANQPILQSPSFDKRTADESFKLLKEEPSESASDPEYYGKKLSRLVPSQIKIDFDDYRTSCEPFFSYMSRWSDLFCSYRESMADTGMNIDQAILFRGNCLHYAANVADGTTQFYNALLRHFDKKRFNSLLTALCHKPELNQQLLKAIEIIFQGFPPLHSSRLVPARSEEIKSSEINDLGRFIREQEKKICNCSGISVNWQAA